MQAVSRRVKKLTLPVELLGLADFVLFLLHPDGRWGVKRPTTPVHPAVLQTGFSLVFAILLLEG